MAVFIRSSNKPFFIWILANIACFPFYHEAWERIEILWAILIFWSYENGDCSFHALILWSKMSSSKYITNPKWLFSCLSQQFVKFYCKWHQNTVLVGWNLMKMASCGFFIIRSHWILHMRKENKYDRKHWQLHFTAKI